MLAKELALKLKAPTIAPLWLVTGEEPLLMIEAADAIRQRARELGYAEREVLDASATWDWSKLTQACQAMSLFSELKLVELRLASFRPGLKGAQALSDLAQMPLEGVVLLITMPYDWSVKKLAWFKKLSAAAQYVECPLIATKDLPNWFSQRFSLQGQSIETEALRILCERCEGNLLAAKQELLKLAYRYPKGTAISAEMVTASVLDVARFDTENLVEAMMTGDAARAIRILESLKASGETIPALTWIVADELESAARVRSFCDKGTPIESAIKQAGVYGFDKVRRVRLAANRLPAKKFEASLVLLGEIDKIGKGLVSKQRDSDPWLELASLATYIAR